MVPVWGAGGKAPAGHCQRKVDAATGAGGTQAPAGQAPAGRGCAGRQLLDGLTDTARSHKASSLVRAGSELRSPGQAKACPTSRTERWMVPRTRSSFSRPTEAIASCARSGDSSRCHDRARPERSTRTTMRRLVEVPMRRPARRPSLPPSSLARHVNPEAVAGRLSHRHRQTRRNRLEIDLAGPRNQGRRGSTV